MSNAEQNPIAELLAGEVLGDLASDERTELERLKSDMSNESLSELQRELQTAAAALQFNGAVSSQPMPESLEKMIRERGHESLRQRDSKRIADTNADSDSMDQPRLAAKTNAINLREVIAWAMLAAALLLCLGIWSSYPDRSRKVATPTLSEMRSDLISRSQATTVAWTKGKTPFDQPVNGDVVWDTKSQTGVMRFVDMPVNDPSVEQYQLWIIDPQRDDEPIDGGVFDISTTGEVLVKIDAKLRVIQPAAFAITIEKPGGVVVSTQERLPLLAAVP